MLFSLHKNSFRYWGWKATKPSGKFLKKVDLFLYASEGFQTFSKKKRNKGFQVIYSSNETIGFVY